MILPGPGSIITRYLGAGRMGMADTPGASNRTTILVLIKGLGIGGAEKLISEGSAHWDRDRFDYRVAYMLPWKDQLVGRLREAHIPVACIGGTKGSVAATFVGLRRLLGSWNVDLIHAHLPTMGILARMVPGVPVVYTEHNLSHSYRQPTRSVNRLTYGLNTAVTAVSQAVADALASFPGPEPIVVPNGISVTAAEADGAGEARRELGLSAADPLVVHVGNIRPHKGHQTLIAAAEKLLRMHPEVTIVSIGGEKHPGDLDRLRKQIAGIGLADRVRFLGQRVDARSFIAAADIYVNPSDFEGLPVSVLEAQALGRPVVATRVGGVPTAVVDRVSGRLVDPGDPEGIAEAVAELLAAPSSAAILARQGRERVEKTHGLEQMIRRYETLYVDTLARTRG